MRRVINFHLRTWWIRRHHRAIADQAARFVFRAHDRNDQQADAHQPAARQELGREPTVKRSPNAWTFRCPGAQILKIAQEPIRSKLRSEKRKIRTSAISSKTRPWFRRPTGDQPDLKEQTSSVLKTLTPREEKVIKMRFGLDDGSEHTRRKIGQSFA